VHVDSVSVVSQRVEMTSSIILELHQNDKIFYLMYDGVMVKVLIKKDELKQARVTLSRSLMRVPLEKTEPIRNLAHKAIQYLDRAIAESEATGATSVEPFLLEWVTAISSNTHP
jgi:hypothetical protein